MARLSRGFTLIEVMLVVLIIGIISTIAIPYYQRVSARAYRSEMMIILAKQRQYFTNFYDNQGTYVTSTVGGLQRSDWNPAGAPGQGAPWSPTARGWENVTFPPEGNIRMRYAYHVTSPTAMELLVCGSIPGLGSDTLGCGGGLSGNYTYTESIVGNAVVDTFELPKF